MLPQMCIKIIVYVWLAFLELINQGHAECEFFLPLFDWYKTPKKLYGYPAKLVQYDIIAGTKLVPKFLMQHEVLYITT
jgi:hypothetical protein